MRNQAMQLKTKSETQKIMSRNAKRKQKRAQKKGDKADWDLIESNYVEQKLEGDVYHVALVHYKMAEIAGMKETDLYGRYYSDYGCGTSPQVSVHCRITDPEGYTVSGYCIDELLPAILFIGKKEGDQIKVPIAGKEITLILDQNRIGDSNFEHRFEDVITKQYIDGEKRTYSISTPRYYTPNISRERQHQMYLDFISKAGFIDSAVRKETDAKNKADLLAMIERDEADLAKMEALGKTELLVGEAI